MKNIKTKDLLEKIESLEADYALISQRSARRIAELEAGIAEIIGSLRIESRKNRKKTGNPSTPRIVFNLSPGSGIAPTFLGAHACERGEYLIPEK